MVAVHLRPPLLFSVVLLLNSPFFTSPVTESDALLKLKKSFTNSTLLDSWDPSSSPCTKENQWVGVVCIHGITTGLHLGRMGLSGTIDIDALLGIPRLRSISFVDNQFTGPMPDFSRLGALKSIYLTKNRFTGEIQPDFFSKMASLKKVWLSENEFTGPIPMSLSGLPNLMELHLEDNHFSGNIPEFDIEILKSFNVSNNELVGSIPTSLTHFDPRAFAGNPGLCGDRVGKECDVESGRTAKLLMGLFSVFCVVVGVATMATRRKRKQRALEFNALEGDMGERRMEEHVTESRRREPSVHNESVRKESVRKESSQRGTGGSELVMVNEEKGHIKMSDLMKAAAEVLGAGGLGSSYKAVMENGLIVVVKRMREMGALGQEEFEAEMKCFGKLSHRNILPPLAFNFRVEEKLLVYEYIYKGSLSYLLHGDRGPWHDELDWSIRLKIIRGIARGVAYLHKELRGHNLPHGNLKSANVLIGLDLEPLLIDYGFLPLVGATQAARTLLAFRSPEFLQYSQVSTKSDVYCLGIVILEILTGKYPCQYHGKGGTDIVQWAISALAKGREMEMFDPEISRSENVLAGMKRLLQLGMACVESEPEQRPNMSEVVQRMEELAGEESALAPMLKDKSTELSSGRRTHVQNVRDGYAELKTLQSGRENFGDHGSMRRSGDVFDIS